MIYCVKQQQSMAFSMCYANLLSLQCCKILLKRATTTKASALSAAAAAVSAKTKQDQARRSSTQVS